MKKSNKLLSLTLALVLCLSLAACGGAPAATPTPAAPTATPASTPDNTVYKITYAGTVPDSHPVILSMTKAAEEMKTLSNDRLIMTIYPNNQIGDSRANLEAMQEGTVQIGEISTAPLAYFTKNYLPLSLPFFFKDFDQAHAWANSEFAVSLGQKTAEENGFFPLTFALSGARTLTNSVRAVSSPKDMAGLKIRVMENDIYIKAFEAMGAAATPMSYAEVFTALQQKTIDGQDNPSAINVANAFYEVQSHWTDLNHTIDLAPIMVSADWYNSLPEDLKTIFTDCVKKAADEVWTKVLEQESEYQKTIATGCEMTYLTEEQRAVFKDTCQSVYEWFATTYPDIDLDSYLNSLK